MKKTILLLSFEIFALAAASSFASELRTIQISHENDSKNYVAITISEKGADTNYAFQVCDYETPSACRKIGRYDFYRAQDLKALEDKYRMSGYAVLGVEATMATFFGIFALVQFRKTPTLAKDFKEGVLAEAKASGSPTLLTDEGPSLSALNSASFRGVARPEAAHLEAVPRRSAPILESPQSDAVGEKVPDAPQEPSPYSGVAKLAGKVYKRFVAPALYLQMLQSWSSFSEFTATMSSLLVSFISPPGHFRAAELIHDILAATSNVALSNRYYASITEFATRHRFKDMEQVRTEIEDVLAACRP